MTTQRMGFNNRLGGVNLIMISKPGETLESGDTVLFDLETLEPNDIIDYDSTTGIITLLARGYYAVEYSINVQTGTAPYDFKAVGTSEPGIHAFGITAPQQVVGHGLVEGDIGENTLKIVYEGKTPAVLATTPVQATITIHRIA